MKTVMLPRFELNEDVSLSIKAFVSLDRNCRDCGREMQLRVNACIDHEAPVNLIWVCSSCETYNGKPLYRPKRTLCVEVPGTSHSEKISYIREVISNGTESMGSL